MGTTIASTKIVLNGRPGPVSADQPRIGHDGNLSDAVQDVVNPAFEPGYQFHYFDPISQGRSVLTYLKYKAGNVAAAVGHVAALYEGGDWYEVTNDGDDGAPNTPPAILVTAMTDGRWGFFWTGGVCPAKLCPTLAAATITTDDGVVNGAIAFKDGTDPDRLVLTAVASGVNACGFSTAAD